MNIKDTQTDKLCLIDWITQLQDCSVRKKLIDITIGSNCF